MIKDPTQPNVEMYCGILDVYNEGVVASFITPSPGVCNVKERIDITVNNSSIVSDLDIEV